ncbi:MAG: LCP family protein [Treponema sp.]|uniref:LCP family protein n=1 Tax=Treponema sp. TaxID=166 RepID=UPI003FA1AF8A
MKEGKNIIFLLLILVMLIPSGIIVARNLKVDPISTSLSDDNVLKVLFIIEQDNVPISTNIIANYAPTRRAAMFDIPANIGLILQQLERTGGIGTLYTEKGANVYREEIEKLTGVDIPFYISCSLTDFVHLTDLIGGLSVFIPSSVDIESETYGRILLPSGSVLLDGDKVRKYLLYEDEADAEGEPVTRKQKAVLAFLRGLYEHPEIFEKEQFKVLSPLLRSNITGEDFKQLLEYLSQTDSERLVPQRLTGAVRMVDSKELLFPFRDGQQIKEIIGQTLAALASKEGTTLERVYALEVLNGTDTNGLARTASELYQSFGYDVIRIGNAPQSGVEHTVLIDRIGNEAVAKIVAQVVRCENIESVQVSNDHSDSESNVDFTLILGKDFNGYTVRQKK